MAKKRGDRKEEARQVRTGPVFELMGHGDLWHSGPCYKYGDTGRVGHWHSRAEVEFSRRLVAGIRAFAKFAARSSNVAKTKPAEAAAAAA